MNLRPIAGGLAVGTAVVLTSIGLAAPASAGNCTGPVCGVYVNKGDLGLQVRPDFGTDAGKFTLRGGESSRDHGHDDVDQVYVPPGRDVLVDQGGPSFRVTETGWLKLPDSGFAWGLENVSE